MAKEEFLIFPTGSKGIGFDTRLEDGRIKAKLNGGKSRFVSDGYHTFDELYQFRMLYNAALFNQLALDEKHTGTIGYNIHKSTKHADGENCFGGGWFIVVAYLNGQQISNHYKVEYWNLFKVEARERADEWDGHSPQDVINRLTEFVKEKH